MGERIPGPTCGSQLGPDWIDSGTTALNRCEPPGSTQDRSSASSPWNAETLYYYSDAYKVVVDVPFSIAPHMTWDAY